MKFARKALSAFSFTAASSAIVASAQVAPTTSRPNGGPVGQTAPDPQPSPQTSDNAFVQPHQSTSLLRVAMSTQVPQPQTTPGQQNSLANISFLAVPEPK